MTGNPSLKNPENPKPFLWFDKAPETDLWSNKQATSFPCKK